MSLSKYKSRKVYFDIRTQQLLTSNDARGIKKELTSDLICFDSKHEYEVFKTLVGRNDYSLYLQHSLQLIPSDTSDCYPNGKKWRVDFLIQNNSQTIAIVEAKGFITKDFPYILTLLESYQPTLFNILWLVFPKKIPNNRVVNALLKTSMKERIVVLRDFPTRWMSLVTR